MDSRIRWLKQVSQRRDIALALALCALGEVELFGHELYNGKPVWPGPEWVARGLSNTDVAAALFLSQATVKTHIGRIFAKLEVRDRAQAVIAAYNAGLVKPAI